MNDDEETIHLNHKAERIDVGVTSTGYIIVALSDLDSFISLTPDDLEVVVEALLEAYEMVTSPQDGDAIH